MLIILGYILTIIGVFLLLTTAIGIIRLPDFYTRLHAVGISDSLGAPFVLAGVACFFASGIITLKLILLIVFLLITGPTATHALAKAAFSANLQPWRNVPNNIEQDTTNDQEDIHVSRG